MTENPKSPFLDPEVPSLADALQRFEELDVKTGRLARVRSAISRLSRQLGKPPDQLPAHQGHIITQINRLKRRPTAIGAKSLSNIKSELLFLVRTAYGRGKRSAQIPLSPGWLALQAALGNGPDWWKLTRLGRYCSGQGITPDAVDDETVAAFGLALAKAEEMDDPESHVRATIRAWNRAREHTTDATLRPLTVPPQRRNRWTIEPEQFPATFQAEVEAWILRLTVIDPFDLSGPARALKPETVKGHRHRLYKAASALVFSGRPIESVGSLADLVADESFVALMGHLLERQGDEKTEALHGLAGTLLAVARHQVGLPHDQIERLGRRVVRLAPDKPSGFSEKTRARLAPFEDDRVLGVLLYLPMALLEEAATERNDRKRVVLAQMAVAIEIELFMPLRRENLVALNLDKHFRRLVVDGRERWIVEIPRVEVKNSQSLTFELPPESVTLIERALHFYEAKDGWLFPGRGAGPKHPVTLGEQVKQTVEARLGVAFNMHLFRAIAGLLHLRENPDGFEAVRALLGDRDDEVVRNHYSFVADGNLIAKAQETITRTRARLNPMSRRRPRGKAA